MTAEFNVWLLVVGLVVGAGLVWLVIMDSRRRESEVDEIERPREAAWLSSVMADDGYDVSPEAAERLLLLHRAYLQAAPPDEVIDFPEAERPGSESVIDWSAPPVSPASPGWDEEPERPANEPAPASQAPLASTPPTAVKPQPPADAPDGLRRPG